MATAARIPSERRRGRQPALPSDEEQRLILDATLRVLRRRDFDRATLDEVLSEAGLSTRALYRHYSSKDELLVALFRREATALATILRRMVAEADDPVAGVQAWVEEILAIGYEARRAARAGLLRLPGNRDAAGLVEVRHAAAEALTEPLVEVLERGRADGSFPDADPPADARTIHALAFHFVEEASGPRRRADRADAVAQVLRYALPALGATVPAV